MFDSSHLKAEISDIAVKHKNIKRRNNSK